MNGDILTSLDYGRLLAYHRAAGAALTIAGYRKEVKIDLGVLELDEGGTRVRGYVEKPRFTYPVSMGIYVYEPRVLCHIPRGCYFDFPSLVLRLLECGEPVACYGSDDLWLDIGRPEDHAEAQRIFLDNRQAFGGF
jgi:NDP-sugar pyrophosphorylase family protein